MKLVKYRFEPSGLVADIVWCTEPEDDWLMTIGRACRIYTDMVTLPNKYNQDLWLKDNEIAAIEYNVREIRKGAYEGLSSRPITEEKDEACMC